MAGGEAKPTSRWVHGLGIAVALLACVFVWREIRAAGILSFAVWRDPGAWIGLTLLAVVYAAAGLLLAVAWVSLLNSGSWGSLARRDGVSIFARTQLLKYLPSNVLHVAGRFASLRHRGVPNGAIIRSTALEHLLLVTVALCLVAVLVLPNPSFLSGLGSRLALGRYFALGGFLLIALVGLGLVALKGGWLPRLRAWVLDELSAAVAIRAALLHSGFFLATGVIAVAVARLGGVALAPASVATTTGTLAFAWLAGFLTPGAPGGIGVREAVLIVGLEPVLGLEGVTFVAVGYRFVTTLGDLLLAGIGVGIAKSDREDLETPAS